MGPRTADKARKQFIDCFQQFGLRITCQVNMKTVNFLDVTFSLPTGKYQPYRKDGNQPMFISANSNHPPSILKQLPKAIGYRISELSSNKDEFEKAAPIYNNALKASGFKSKIEYTKPSERNPQQHGAKRRSQKVTWFNPPYSCNVETNVGKTFYVWWTRTSLPPANCTRSSIERL